MKSKTVIELSIEKKAAFIKAIDDISHVIKMDNPIKSKDKQGGKLSDKLLALLPMAIDNLPKIENYLPRDFDANTVKTNETNLTLLLEYLDSLEEQKKNIQNICTLIRIELQTDYTIIYEAAQKAASVDFMMSGLRDKLGEPFKRESNNNNDAAKNDSAKTPQPVAVK